MMKTGKINQVIEKKDIYREKTLKDGFTLLELAIAMTVLGVIIAGLISIIHPLVEAGNIKETEKKMERIIDVMAIYAQRNNRIPCPADPDQASVAQPFGAELGSGAAGNTTGSCDGAGDLIEGIVPYKTLGLNEEDIMDAWDDYITYRIDPAYTRDPSAATNVHARCRVDLIWTSDSGTPPVSNYNPAKARFCCAPAVAGSSLTITDETGDLLWPFTRSAADFAAPDTFFPAGTVFDTVTDNVTMPSFVLISHGRNGYGAFMPDGTRMAALGAAGNTAGDDEFENQDGDDTYVVSPRNTIQTTAYFDDIVMWRTQDQLYSETGEGSCVFP